MTQGCSMAATGFPRILCTVARSPNNVDIHSSSPFSHPNLNLCGELMDGGAGNYWDLLEELSSR